MTGILAAQASTNLLGAQVLLIDPDPHSRAARARILLPFADVAVSGSADSALESIEAGAQFDVVIIATPGADLPLPALHRELLRFDPQLARRLLVLASDGVSEEEADYCAECKLPVLHAPEQPRQLTLMTRALLSRAGQRRLELIDAAAPRPQLV